MAKKRHKPITHVKWTYSTETFYAMDSEGDIWTLGGYNTLSLSNNMKTAAIRNAGSWTKKRIGK